MHIHTMHVQISVYVYTHIVTCTLRSQSTPTAGSGAIPRANPAFPQKIIPKQCWAGANPRRAACRMKRSPSSASGASPHPPCVCV